MEKLAVSVVEAARLISVSKSTAYALIEQGVLPAIRVGEKRLIVPVTSLQDWLEQQCQKGNANNPEAKSEVMK